MVYMKGRGMQLQKRLELRQGTDETVIQRLLAIHGQQDELGQAIAEAIDGQKTSADRMNKGRIAHSPTSQP